MLFKKDKSNLEELEKFIKNSRTEEENKKFWNERAKNFAKVCINQVNEIDEFMLGEIRKLNIENPRKKVVDIGCGTGNYADSFLKFDFSYLGQDISENMIENAKASHVDYKEISFTNKNWKDIGESFDIAFTSNSPAIDSIDSLKRFMELSSSYCIIHKFIKEEDNISKLLSIPYLNKAHNNYDYCKAIMNILWIYGYFPEFKIHETKEIKKSFAIDEFIELNRRALSDLDENFVRNTLNDHSENGKINLIIKRKRALIIWKP